MGIEIDQRSFSPADYQRFAACLEEQLRALTSLLEAPEFGRGPETLGSELELYIVDRDGRPAHLNQALLARAADPQLTLEIDRYNLEFNLSPQMFAQQGLSQTEQEIISKVSGLNALAADFDAAVVPIGILPTLQPDDFGRHALTDRVRYHALVDQLVARRGADFAIDIDGADPLHLAMKDISLEGANTSFQIHWRVEPEHYAATFNALQLLTPPVLALAANSPGIFGHDLWDETRIPLFKQSIDTRQPSPDGWHDPPRVGFGHGWVRDGALELFQETVRLFPPLLPCCASPGATQTTAPPELAELRLHGSTVWSWNRPVYDDAAGGHLRIELRAFPAGPTAIDMVANAALILGLARYFRDRMHQLMPGLPFALAERNFYRAAQYGIDAELVWPSAKQQQLGTRPVLNIIADLLPAADSGLDLLGVSREERDRYLSVVEARIRSRQSGARWQRNQVARRQQSGETRDLALRGMLDSYRQYCAENVPVAQWT